MDFIKEGKFNRGLSKNGF